MVGSVLGVELLDDDTGHGRCCGYVANESLVFEHTGQAVLRPQRRRQSTAIRIDKQEFDLVTDQRLDTGFGEYRFDAAQRSAAAGEPGRAVLLEERAGRPGQSVAENAQRGQVDSDALIPDDTDVFGERDAGLVDGEAMPDPAGA